MRQIDVSDRAEVVEWEPPVRGPSCYCPIIALCEPPTEDAYKKGLPLHVPHHKWLAKLCVEYGFVQGDIKLVGLCPPLPKDTLKSASKKWRHVEKYKDITINKIEELKPQVIVTFGELATRTMTGRPTKITKARGIPIIENNKKIFPMLSPGFVRRIPENQPIFEADIQFLKSFMDNYYEYEAPQTSYHWISNPGSINRLFNFKKKNLVIAVDTETQGGTRFWDENVKLLSVQICPQSGLSFVFPVCDDWCGHRENAGKYEKNRKFLKTLLENPEIKKLGFNIKFEQLMCRKIGINIKGWLHDAQLMLFNIDENLLEKSLDIGVSIYVPELAGGKSILAEYDKADMASVPKNLFLQYSAFDADATFRLAQRLKPLLDKDPRQRNCYRRIQMPAILAFADVIEPHGVKVNTKRLEAFGKELDVYLDKTYKKLIKYTPAEVKRDHLERKKDLKFSRADFVRDILFSENGFNLEPITFTESTEDLDEDEKVASTSSKKHLPYFISEPQIIAADYTIGDYVTELIQYQKAQKLQSTYSGSKEKNTGLWQYLDKDNYIHPSYMLHRTNTGRTSSSDPNGQNWPVRGVWAKSFDENFDSEPGFVRVSCDESQIELRLVAWMAMEPTMLKIYQEGGDIHAMTAANRLGISLNEFMSWKENNKDRFDIERYNSKSQNFGLIYGLSAYGYMIYSKTEYGLDFSLEECYKQRNDYFNNYYGLPVWHTTMKDFAKKNGYVRSLLGRVRHLPGVYSDDQAIVAASLRYSINSPIQSMASELGVMAMTRFAQQAPKEIIKTNAFIHDDIRADVREDYAEEAASALKWVVENPPWHLFNLNPVVPIIGEVKIAREERPEIKAIKPSWWKETA